MKKTLRSATALLILAAMCPCVLAAENVSIAYKLAAIDAGRMLDDNAIEVKRAQAAIAAARSVCLASDDVLTDQAVKIANTLKGEGIFARPVEILEGLKPFLPATKRSDCTALFALYITVRERSQGTHSDAMVAMRDILSAGSKR